MLKSARILPRIRRFRDAGSKPDNVASTNSTASTSRWTNDARLELKNLSVIDVSPTGAATDYRVFKVRAIAKGANAWSLSGQGVVQSEPGSKGSIGWDLKHSRPLSSKWRAHSSSMRWRSRCLRPCFHHCRSTRSTVRACVRISRSPAQAWRPCSVEGDLSIRDLMFASSGLAQTEVGPISLGIHGRALWTPARRELSDLQAEIRVGKTKSVVSGVLAWPADGYRVDLAAEMARAQCRDVLAAVPAGLLGELATVELGGDIAAKLTVHVDAPTSTPPRWTSTSKNLRVRAVLLAMLDRAPFRAPVRARVFEPDGTYSRWRRARATADVDAHRAHEPVHDQG